jgi:hypothetical protein
MYRPPSPALRERQHEAVFAASDFVDSDHVCAVVGEQCAAERPSDETPEVEHPDACKNAFVHRVDPMWQHRWVGG